SPSYEAPTVTLRTSSAAVDVSLVEPADTAYLHLDGDGPRRWRVVDDRGVGWFPHGVLRKWDARHRPWFAAYDAVVTVPAGVLDVECTSGLDHTVETARVSAAAGEAVPVRLHPTPWVEPRRDGWVG